MPDPVRVVLSGVGGKMGSMLARMIGENPGFELVGGLDRVDADAPAASSIRRIEDGAALVRAADVVIDFSAPAFLGHLLTDQAEALAGRALVVGTTGLTSAENALLDRAAIASPVLTAANFSIGINLLMSLAARAARALGGEYDVEIVEAHHRHKEDAPSGTALALGEAVAEARGAELAAVRRDGRSGRPGPRSSAEICFHALRGGEIVGEHEVLFIGPVDRIELAHRAADRSLFAAGALRAAGWLVGRPAGRYHMRDVLGLD